ncbi:MAG TPA: integrin alpha [Planctomycetota bacterium]|nr:integrin alpha [Planctomycetota bacterium]
MGTATTRLLRSRAVWSSLAVVGAVALAVSPAAAQFDQLNWVFHTSSAGGFGILTPEQMALVGPDDGCAPPGKSVAYTAVAPFDGTVVVSADYHTSDEQPEFDNFNYILNSQTIVVSTSSSWSGQLIFDVPAGAAFGFSVGATDCQLGAGAATLTDFGFFPKFGSLPALDGTQAGEHFGARLAAAGDLDGDGVSDLVVGVPDGSTGGVAAGRLVVVPGDLHGTLLALAGDAAGDDFGFSVAAGQDLNLDGVPDLAVGVPKADVTSPIATDAGRIQMLSGADGSLLREFVGEKAFDKAGFAVAFVGDIDGDGVADVGCGAPFHDEVASNAGQVVLLSGASGSVMLEIHGQSAGDRFGSALAGAGDIDLDGVPDLVVGAPGVNGPYTPSNGPVTVHSALDGSILHVFQAPATNYGTVVAGAGDCDGDGVPDVVGSAPTYYGYIDVHSGADGSLLHTFTGSLDGDLLGSALDVAGDFDGDGAPDLILGATQAESLQKGYVQVRSGRTGALLYIQPGDQVLGQFGAAVAWLGDVDGDGRPEVAVGAPFGNKGGPGAGGVRTFEPYVAWAADGAGLAGALGIPVLSGKGLVGTGAPATITLEDARPDAIATLVVGSSKVLLPIKGGLLVPAPEILLLGLMVDSQGSLPLSFTWPPGLLAPGFDLWLQIWIADPTGPHGFAASNGLHAEAP